MKRYRRIEMVLDVSEMDQAVLAKLDSNPTLIQGWIGLQFPEAVIESYESDDKFVYLEQEE